MRRWSISMVVAGLLSWGCGEETTAVQPTAAVPVQVRLMNVGCDTSRAPDFRAVEVQMLSPRTERSSCVTGRPQTFEAIETTLSGRIAFRDLPEGKVTLRLQGYRAEECRADKLGMCGIVEATLASEPMKIDLPINCDEGSGAAGFRDCMAR